MNINLLPWREEILAYNKKIFLRLILFALLFGALFLMFVHYLFFEQVNYTKSYTQALEQEKVSLVTNLATYFKQEKIHKEITSRFLTLQQLQLSRFDTIRLLNDIVKVVPKGVYLNFLQRDGNQVEFSGSANSNLQIAELIKGINQSPNMDIASVKRVEKKEGEKLISTSFNLHAVLTLPSLIDSGAQVKTQGN